MELGISMFGDVTQHPHTKKHITPAQRLNEMLEQVKLADEVGLDVFEVGEHHRPDYSVTNPQLFLSAAAAITKNIRLGSAVTVLSSSDPVRLFEDFSMLDNISNGRAHIMAGRGSFIESFPLFGFSLDDYDILFEDKLMMLLELINKNGTDITWDGRLTQSLKNVNLYPKPVQEQLPVWIAVGGTPASVLRAARLGLPITFAIIGGLPVNFKPLVDYYKENYLAAGHDVSKMQIGINSHTFLGDSNTIKDAYYPFYAAQMDTIGKDRGWAPFSKEVFMNTTRPEGAYFMGEPNAVIDKILQQHEWFGHTRFVGQMDVGAPDHSMIMKSIELFGTKVAPEIRKALK
ncbi:MAG TPA: LLM class flavin-dependent oxidoreductase [Flavobacterium sp.]|nr:LLM class flavin-dependent oxidoreductase [Flavobacterium sp.]